jgi:hypothetical protein
MVQLECRLVEDIEVHGRNCPHTTLSTSTHLWPVLELNEGSRGVKSVAEIMCRSMASNSEMIPSLVFRTH